MTTDTVGRAHRRGDARAHVAAAHAGKGMGTLLRITMLTLRHPWQASFAIGATIIASILQLIIPRLLGHAVDQAQGILDAGDGAEQAL